MKFPHHTKEFSLYHNQIDPWEAWCMKNIPHHAWRTFSTGVNHMRFEFKHVEDQVAFELMRST